MATSKLESNPPAGSSNPSKAKPVAAHPAGPSTLSVHAGEARQKMADAITDAICCASTYTFESTQSVIDFIEQKQPREEYGRYGSPNEKVVERKLAALDNGEDAVVFASGMAAVVGLYMASCQPATRLSSLTNVTIAAVNSVQSTSLDLAW